MFAVEDGHGGVLCADGAIVTAQLVEHFGKSPKLWTDRDTAAAEGRIRFGRCKVVEVDDRGCAMIAPRR